jgi:hypothetical protein
MQGDAVAPPWPSVCTPLPKDRATCSQTPEKRFEVSTPASSAVRSGTPAASRANKERGRKMPHRRATRLGRQIWGISCRWLGCYHCSKTEQADGCGHRARDRNRALGLGKGAGRMRRVQGALSQHPLPGDRNRAQLLGDLRQACRQKITMSAVRIEIAQVCYHSGSWSSRAKSNAIPAKMRSGKPPRSRIISC